MGEARRRKQLGLGSRLPSPTAQEISQANRRVAVGHIDRGRRSDVQALLAMLMAMSIHNPSNKLMSELSQFPRGKT
jgi:hypothetical protein